MADQPKPEGAEGAAAGGAQPKTPARKRGADDSTQRLADRLAGLAGPGGNAGTAAARPRAARTGTPSSGTRTTPARQAGRKAADTGRGARTVGVSAPMAAEQKKPGAYYGARISHATTPEQLGELEQLRLEENTRRRIAGLPTISLTALLRAATQICLDSDKLRAQMIKDAVNNWNEKDRPSRR